MKELGAPDHLLHTGFEVSTAGKRLVFACESAVSRDKV